MPVSADRSAHARRVQALDDRLRALGSVAVAFSGGVDSSVLLHAAHRVLGAQAVALIADSPSLPRQELDEALELARNIGARVEVLRTEEGDDPRYRANQGNRCYFCKAALFEAMEHWARRSGIGTLAFGEITDDLLDHRPGARAAGEFGVVAPLREAGFDKQAVRMYARDAGLTVAEKPSSACLASRIPVGTEVTPERLARVEKAEESLRALGLRQIRVRHHGARARVEVGPDELARARGMQDELAAALAGAGFDSFELHAYRSPAAPPDAP